jgi:uncharacterized protein (TIGR02246 family)
MRVFEGMSDLGQDASSLPPGKRYEATYEIVHHWLKTVKGGDPQEVADLYAERGVLLGTVAKNIKQGRSVIKTYFDSFLKKRPIGFLNSFIFQDLGSDCGIADGNYTFEMDDKDGKRVSVLARFTFVINLKTGLIMTHHSSSNPTGETTSI